jgi:hypothetical protein
MDDIRNNPNKPWNWQYVSSNPNLTIEMIHSNPDKPWSLYFAGENVKLTPFTLQIIADNEHDGWNWNKISKNPSLTLDIIKQFPDKPWSLHELSFNINLTIAMMVYFMKKEKYHWNWHRISYCTFSHDKQLYLSYHIKNANLLQMHIFFNIHTDQVVNPIEYVFFDNYLLKQILQY